MGVGDNDGVLTPKRDNSGVLSRMASEVFADVVTRIFEYFMLRILNPS